MHHRPVLRLLLTLSVLLPGLPTVERFGGRAGLFAYLLLGAAALLGVQHPRARRAVERIPPRAASVGLGLVLAALLAAFLALYPLAKSGRFGKGSDRDDALNRGAHALVQGENPYAERTYLGNTLSPLPGALLLAAPFALAGNSAWQDLFWSAVLLALALALLRDARAALLFMLAAFFVGVAPLHELATGGDLLANAVYVLAASLLLVWSCEARPGSRPLQLLSAAALGLCLSSRANHLLSMIAVAPALARATSMRRAALLAAVALAVFALLTGGAWLADPALFRAGPAANSARVLAGVKCVPYAAVWLPLLAAASALAAQRALAGRAPMERLLLAYAAPQWVLTVGVVALTSVDAGFPWFRWADYGIAYQLPLLLLGGSPGALPDWRRAPPRLRAGRG